MQHAIERSFWSRISEEEGRLEAGVTTRNKLFEHSRLFILLTVVCYRNGLSFVEEICDGAIERTVA
jgi:hypothetical protein